MTALLDEHNQGSIEVLNDLGHKAGLSWFDYQLEALLAAADLRGPSQRLCLYYKTGAGKSPTALGCMAEWGVSNVLVIAPPATHDQWWKWGSRFRIEVTCISHARFRQKGYKILRDQAIIADEMHLFGGHDGQGWKKLDKLAMHLQAPLVLASATPNYNDADRVYCIQHILDRHSCKGGFLEFIYAHCTTEQNPFGRYPNVTGFRNYPDAAAYLAALPGVQYLPDDLVYTIQDIPVPAHVPAELVTYGLNERRGRIIASQIEERHARVNLGLVDDGGKVRADIYKIVTDLVRAATTPSLVFAAHSTVADALGAKLLEEKVTHAVVTGTAQPKYKTAAIEQFKAGRLKVLVGTATLATGPDGMDKMCDNLIILDDTDDDSLRRQLIGRIMPRGADSDASKKSVHRLVLQ